ncbi:Mov34/MPN/PAD-1 family protein [Deinococcus sp. SL84]|uniref:Mov34/MPN/PAD-1 family protein n=1 Tax=Deinococcus sp. SL84 TaxID=2994663 RepID=UPI0022755F38|nr:Mov34/MPN/PAD-1 family protein [Deinococcus sp. SL84]MCY1704278.1 Mov34/MPN/PAD-1 family protein [Deinococcus sp. SL84]
MNLFIQRHRRDKEAGGMLIGHHPLACNDIILDQLTTPQPADRRSRYRFERDQAAHQTLLNAEWEKSGQKRTYIGEWHTHPEDSPSPSSLDLRSWQKAVSSTPYHGPGLLFIIVGRQKIRVWFGFNGRTDFNMILELPIGGSDGPT